MLFQGLANVEGRLAMWGLPGIEVPKRPEAQVGVLVYWSVRYLVGRGLLKALGNAVMQTKSAMCTHLALGWIQRSLVEIIRI